MWIIFLFGLLQCLLLFLYKRDDFANKNEELYNPSIKNILVTINDMPHQLFGAGLQWREIYPELRKYFYKENSDVTWEDFLTTKFALWIDTGSSTNKALHCSGRAVEKSGILFQIEKAPATSGDLTCYVFSVEDPVAHWQHFNDRKVTGGCVGKILRAINLVFAQGWPGSKNQQK